MSRYIATRAIRGANALVAEADAMLKRALAEKGPDTPVAFPNTAYYLPVIYGMLDHKVTTLGDMPSVLEHAARLLHPLPDERLWVPYLGETLDSGMATLLAAEIIEAVRFVNGDQPERYPGLELTGSTEYPELDGGHLNGPIDDIQLRSWGIQLVDGRMPGFAAVVGAAHSNEAAVHIVRELQRRNILTFLCGNVNGRSIIDQLREEGVEMGYDTYIVPFGKDTISAIYPMGFATRSALTFGGLKAGQWREILIYNKFRVFAFVLALGEVDDLKYAAAAGAISYGFPTIADTIIPEILPTGVTRYEHVVSMPWNEIAGDTEEERAAKLVQQCIEIRGVKVKITEVPIPVSYGSAFEGEVVRRADMRVEFGGKSSRAFEYLHMAPMDRVEDGKIEIVGTGFEDVEEAGSMDLGIVVEVAGRKMQEDFEPVLERQFHYFVNGASGIQHIGQRDITWIRISKTAADKGFNLRHFGEILYARLHADFGAIVDKVQVRLITDPEQHAEWLAKARVAYDYRNQRLANLTDDAVDLFYDCTLCQSFAPTHVCIVSPQRLGLCGAYNWLDCKASFEINPTGPNQPVPKGEVIDPVKGYWTGTNETAVKNSQGTVPEVAMYSIMENPMTACGCFECIVMYIPEVEGVMVVSREDSSMTPAGMTFSTLAGVAGGGLQTPGVMGVGKFYLTSPKFISADGGFKRIVWMSSFLKESMVSEFAAVAEREGVPDLIDRIADERSVTSVDELEKWIKEHNHPVLEMGQMQAASGAEEPKPTPVPAAVEKKAAAETVTAPTVSPAEAGAPRAAEPVPVAPSSAISRAEPVPAAQPEARPAAAAVTGPVAIPGDADVQQIAEISAGIVINSFRRALEAALRELGGTPPPVSVREGAKTPPVAAAEHVAVQAEAATIEEPGIERRELPMVPAWSVDAEAGFEFVKEKWTGKVREITLGAVSANGGTRSKEVIVGGQTAMPFLEFEGAIPHRPVVAVEIQDRKPDDWSPLLVQAWGTAMDDPGEWARAAADAGADLLALQLSLTGRDGNPNTASNARAVVRDVLQACGLPLIVLGPGQVDADNDLLIAVAEEAAGERLVLGVCEEKNYRTIVAAALANNQLVIARTAMDVNLAKQLNILISDMGLSLDRILMDPTCAGVGYGMEYGYSVMERLRLAALQGDSMTQLPMMVTVGYEAWRQKESKVGQGVPESWGDWKERALNWETVTAAALVESGADIVVLRHPESIRRTHVMINELIG
ncbi:MAG: CO dehydrogenase/CO-methylating acetyl-CoA synthase complex subunit beta [Chloroflexi bacterium]|nr:CO dehydrogenase/CO-methylating acetyl-CoA synthase complex subunit beta [Chloroflexota bacterium]